MNTRARTKSAALLVFALLSVGSLWLLASCQKRNGGAEGAGKAPLQPVGGLQVGVANTPDPPHSGDNALIIVVRDAAGKAVRGAAVDAVVSMPAMGAMPYMESRGKVKEVKPGVYRAEYGLAMNGEWDVNVRVRPKGGAAVEAAYRLSTSTPGLAFAGGTPSAGRDKAVEGMPGMSGMSGMSGMPATGSSQEQAGPGAGMESAPGTITIDAARRQEIGIRTAPAQIRNLSATVRAVGRVAYDETRQTEVTLKFSGYVRDLRVDFTGRPVHAGEVLFTAYSPELWSAQKEYIEALWVAGDSSVVVPAPPETELAMAARRRLELWDITPGEIQQIAREGKPREALPIVAPVGGVVTEKNIARGSAFTAGQVLYKIAPLDPAWVLASVYQVDLPLLRVGMAASLTNPYLDERSRHGRVSFISPALQAETRTGQVRVEVPNPRGDLKPGMFVNVELEVALGKRLAVPESAVLPTGERRVVFVDVGNGRLAPREVQLGARAGDYFEVLSGLKPGEVVVTSGNFLVAAESKLKSAAQKW
ncbi:MAG: efflux RND transporter periplasmic adaptor subunit [Gemmatimonadetes bacterium]|nr:MAG: efflux RND transporter periplasmic adaptor subunit [Gemmatimonadota bacterium]